MKIEQRHRSRLCREGRRAGFALIEVLISIALLVVVAAIVYESFAAVINTTETAREGAEELRLRQFLTRSLFMNLSTAYVGYQITNSQFAFVGTSGGIGTDSIEFASSASLTGTTSLPGMMKRVRYEATTGGSELGLMSLSGNGENGSVSSEMRLECTELPLFSTSMSEDDMSTGDSMPTLSSIGSDTQRVPGWSVPISSISFSFFDGEEWVDEWDSMAFLRMPWCVRVQINFARGADGSSSEWGLGGDLDSADFEMVIPIPLGEGTYEGEVSGIPGVLGVGGTSGGK